MALPSSPAHRPRLGTGLLAAWKAGYGFGDLRHDILAGLTIGIVAVPLSMALAIATGVAPQHGLYTAIVAGIVIALTGGSRFSVSGPTAAFVVILLPIVQHYGLGGLLIATLMAGMILVGLGLARLGALIQFVPYPVVLGFTAGIAVVIATLQVPDFLGLEVARGEHFTESLTNILAALPETRPAELAIGVITLAVLLLWPRLRSPVPAPLVGLVAGALAAYVANHWLGGDIATIASRFQWNAEGESGVGIPPIAPSFALPWHMPNAEGEPLAVSFDLIRSLLGPAFAIAMLAAIESLLCAVVADGMTRTRHDPNAELIGLGLGNIAVPFFGGITATGALARTATNIRSGARSPIAAVVHALVVLLAVIALAGLLGLVPMTSLAALLFIIAWNMSEARMFVHTLRSSPSGDVAILAICFALTVLFDMVLAVSVGMGLAAALFIRRMTQVTQTKARPLDRHPEVQDLPPQVALYDINGPMFFGVAEKALSSLQMVDPDIRIVMVDMHGVPSIDGTALVALRRMVEEMRRQNVALILIGLSPRQIVKLRRVGIRTAAGELTHCASLARARTVALRWLEERRPAQV
ncbi:SulP family sulfate permease [Onishia taeanensis]|uniref:SulP family sulfate permease n=1 Tax=Onishia taeanensis TaxID=284577 RepID=A0A328XY86_9GAMM|nr:C4-dicarboxylic acid transporter DauA [Halomonas taeanensis]RAR60817.1 SulP family sulfate permease [Halomonas taeanensis]